MGRPAASTLSTSERDLIHEQTLWVLERVGVSFPSARALDVLERGGADVDRERRVARLPRELVEMCLGMAPGTVLLAGRDPAHDIQLGADRPLVCCADGEGTLVADDATGEIRDATVADMCDVCRLYDALPEIDFLWTSLSAPSLDPETAPLAVDAIALRESSKHLQSVSPKAPDQVPRLVAMLEAAGGASLDERPIYSFLHCTVAPLQHDPDITDASLDLVASGATICLTSMPQMGSTAPLSVAGLSIVVLAELLSGVVLFQLARPGCRIVVEPMPGGTDMRTGQYLGGAPEVALANLVCVELCRSFGLPTIGSGSTTDALGVDFQAGVEDVFLWLSVALAGAHGLVASSFVGGSRVLSPAKVLLDADAIGMLHRVLGGVRVDDETALLADIAEVGPGGHFLGRNSTRAMARSGELFEPRAFRRGRLEGRLDATLAADAAERARRILDEHEVTPLPDDAERRVDEILREHGPAGDGGRP
jgi:trimethylamine--corrinoid protein Co-methyltransferase